MYKQARSFNRYSFLSVRRGDKAPSLYPNYINQPKILGQVYVYAGSPPRFFFHEKAFPKEDPSLSSLCIYLHYPNDNLPKKLRVVHLSGYGTMLAFEARLSSSFAQITIPFSFPSSHPALSSPSPPPAALFCSPNLCGKDPRRDSTQHEGEAA